MHFNLHVDGSGGALGEPAEAVLCPFLFFCFPFFVSSIVDTFLCWFCLLCFLYADALTRNEGMSWQGWAGVVASLLCSLPFLSIHISIGLSETAWPWRCSESSPVLCK